MRSFRVSHLDDSTLVKALKGLVAEHRLTTAKLLAHLAEVDLRKLYAMAGYPSMFAYCVEELRLSEDAAGTRILAARAAREFPQLLEALAEGRLHLTAIRLLAPHLTAENVDELVGSATHGTKADIESLLMQRFQEARPVFQRVREVLARQQHVPEHVVRTGEDGSLSLFDGENVDPLPVNSETDPPPPPQYALQVIVDQETYDMLQRAQALLSHTLPSGDIAKVLKRALGELLVQLEKSKFAATDKPRRQAKPSRNRRTIPAPIRREVWKRDMGQCTFVAANGHRCQARRLLEFDHVKPVARGGKATVEGIRLRCRAHNQLEAERIFGREFMQKKRDCSRASEFAKEAAG